MFSFWLKVSAWIFLMDFTFPTPFQTRCQVRTLKFGNWKKRQNQRRPSKTGEKKKCLCTNVWMRPVDCSVDTLPPRSPLVTNFTPTPLSSVWKQTPPEFPPAPVRWLLIFSLSASPNLEKFSSENRCKWGSVVRRRAQPQAAIINGGLCANKRC